MSKRFEKKSDKKRSTDSKRVLSLRRALNLSQRELALKFYVSPAAIAHWESGEREVRGPALKLLELYESGKI